jgi:single-strand DNA-binding protein
MANLSLAGRIGSDAETRTTQGGQKVTQFSMPFDTGFGDKKKTTWVRCSYWGDRGERVAQYLTKGSLVFVSGEPSLSTYEGKEGPRTSLELNVQSLKLLGGKKDTPVADNAKATKGDDFDSEIPF